MSTTGLLLALGTALIGAAWIMFPLWLARRDASALGTESQKSREALITRYERILASIRDLDEDFLVGKLSEAAYQQERAAWVAEGTVTLQAIEQGKRSI